MRTPLVIRSLFTTSLLALAIAGCGNASEGGAAASGSAKATGGAPAAKADAKPTGPAFKTKMMGMDMVQPLVQKDLIAPLAGLEITAPDKTEVKESRGDVHLVSAGVNYSISVSQRAFDKAKSLEIFKMVDEKGTVVDESDTHLIFKRESGSHLLSATVTVDGKPYVCGSVATASSFTREEIDQTLASCKTLKKKG